MFDAVTELVHDPRAQAAAAIAGNVALWGLAVAWRWWRNRSPKVPSEQQALFAKLRGLLIAPVAWKVSPQCSTAIETLTGWPKVTFYANLNSFEVDGMRVTELLTRRQCRRLASLANQIVQGLAKVEREGNLALALDALEPKPVVSQAARPDELQAWLRAGSWQLTSWTSWLWRRRLPWRRLPLCTVAAVAPRATAVTMTRAWGRGTTTCRCGRCDYVRMRNCCCSCEGNVCRNSLCGISLTSSRT